MAYCRSRERSSPRAPARGRRRAPAPGRLILALLWGALATAPAQAVVPDARTRDALEMLVISQLASKACTFFRINFAAMTSVIAAAGLRASDTTRLYGQTVGELGEQYAKAAHDDLSSFCATAWAQLGSDGNRAHMLERTDAGQ